MPGPGLSFDCSGRWFAWIIYYHRRGGSVWIRFLHLRSSRSFSCLAPRVRGVGDEEDLTGCAALRRRVPDAFRRQRLQCRWPEHRLSFPCRYGSGGGHLADLGFRRESVGNREGPEGGRQSSPLGSADRMSPRSRRRPIFRLCSRAQFNPAAAFYFCHPT